MVAGNSIPVCIPTWRSVSIIQRRYSALLRTMVPQGFLGILSNWETNCLYIEPFIGQAEKLLSVLDLGQDHGGSGLYPGNTGLVSKWILRNPWRTVFSINIRRVENTNAAVDHSGCKCQLACRLVFLLEGPGVFMCGAPRGRVIRCLNAELLCKMRHRPIPLRNVLHTSSWRPAVVRTLRNPEAVKLISWHLRAALPNRWLHQLVPWSISH